MEYKKIKISMICVQVKIIFLYEFGIFWSVISSLYVNALERQNNLNHEFILSILIIYYNNKLKKNKKKKIWISQERK